MSEFPGSPKIMKGAIVAIAADNPLARLIRFQYNPQTLSRSLSPSYVGSDTARDSSAGVMKESAPTRESRKTSYAPTETISLKIHIDAADQLENSDPIAMKLGIHPQLAALEMLMYPKVLMLNKIWAKAEAGVSSVDQGEVPVVFFFWGPSRIQPVRITSLSIEETNFDTMLNPIHAEVSIGLETLTYRDVKGNDPAFGVYMVHQVLKEAFATINGINTALNALK